MGRFKMVWQNIAKIVGGTLSGTAKGLGGQSDEQTNEIINQLDAMGNIKFEKKQPEKTEWETAAEKTMENKTPGKLNNYTGARNSGEFVGTNIISDETEKSVTELMPKISDCYKNIEAYIFKYKPGAQHKFGVDNNPHVGVIAQELQSNPATETTVHALDDGTLTVNPNELAMTNAAAIADLSRRLEQLEKSMGNR